MTLHKIRRYTAQLQKFLTPQSIRPIATQKPAQTRKRCASCHNTSQYTTPRAKPQLLYYIFNVSQSTFLMCAHFHSAMLFAFVNRFMLNLKQC